MSFSLSAAGVLLDQGASAVYGKCQGVSLRPHDIVFPISDHSSCALLFQFVPTFIFIAVFTAKAKPQYKSREVRHHCVMSRIVKEEKIGPVQ